MYYYIIMSFIRLYQVLTTCIWTKWRWVYAGNMLTWVIINWNLHILYQMSFLFIGYLNVNIFKPFISLVSPKNNILCQSWLNVTYGNILKFISWRFKAIVMQDIKYRKTYFSLVISISTMFTEAWSQYIRQLLVVLMVL